MAKHAIELRFDAAIDARIRALIASAIRDGTPVVQPHVSLAVFDDVADAAPLIAAAGRVARATSPIDVRLAGVGAFPGDQRAVFLLPMLTGPLLALHDCLHAELGDAGRLCWPLYRPGEWVPHGTLATAVADVGATLERARQTFAFGPARLDAIAVRAFDPARDLATEPLAMRSAAPTLDVADGLRLRPPTLDDAAAMFALTDANRDRLREWLPWLDGTRSPDDTRRFLASLLVRGATAPVWLIESRGHLCGICGFNWVANRTAEIGYWLDVGHQRRGIMTACVARVVRHAFETTNVNRVTIPVAVDNARSRAIPERLGFRAEGVLREAEWLYDHFVDHVLYARLRGDA